ncbi:MAG: NAD-dependent epimerase/dehydratase family protein [Desulfobacteraceae bacterium]|nr:NAD-dependent epimerase/dehydratase family protein [Desulfobacteraceae bacterium]
MKKVLLTGAEGFVGKRLKFLLERRGYNVKPAVWKGSKNHKVFSDKSFCFENLDSETDWSDAFKSENIDTVVHLAARVHVMREKSENPLNEFLKVNCEGTRKLAEQAAENNVGRFIFLSTIGVNGSFTTDAPFNENSKISPHNNYSMSKYMAELELLKTGRQTGMEIVILRPPLVYGPGVGANFLKLLNLVNRLSLLPFGNVSNKKSFIYLDNLCDAIISCTGHGKSVEGIFTVSDGTDISTKELVLKISGFMNKKTRLFSFSSSLARKLFYVFGKANVYDSLWRSLEIDSSKIKNTLGFKSGVSIDKGLYLTVENYLKKSNPLV